MVETRRDNLIYALVDTEEVVLRVEVEGVLELEAREGLEVLLLRERADHGRAKLEALGEARTVVLRADARREHLLRARDEVLRFDRKVGREEQGLLVDAPVRKSIGRDSAVGEQAP